MAIDSVSLSNVAEAANLLAANPRARYFGGGTLLMRDINEGDQSFDTIVRVLDQSMRQIRASGNRLVLGAGVTMAAIMANRDCAFLAMAARSVGGPAIRNTATVGGNLFATSPYGDFTTALMALDAELSLADGRSISLQELLANRGQGVQPLVVNVSVIRPSVADNFRFLKVSRVKPKGISVITLAAHLPRAGSTLQHVRIAYGAMAPTPMRVAAVEQVLEGKPLDTSTIEAAVTFAVDGIDPPTDPIASSWYRREVAPVHLRRMLLGSHSSRITS